MSPIPFTKTSAKAAAIIVFWLLSLHGTPVFGGVPPDNVFNASDFLPATMKRVLVLPLAHEDSSANAASGCEDLAPVLRSELIKTEKFEVVSATSQSIQSLTGQPAWTGAEVLPPDFLVVLQRVYGCDGILFCDLSTFHAYPPLAIGWRLKLVDVSTGKIIWAADTVFDASDPAVCQRAKAYERQQEGTDRPKTFLRRVWTWLNRDPEPVTDDPWVVLNSPRYFAEFSASTLLATLPKR